MCKIQGDYIVEIAKQRSFSKAAEKLFITQPSLSRYIINLEENLQIEIFDRSKSPIEVTEAGEKLIEYIYKHKELKNDLMSELALLKSNKKAELKIGIVPWRVPIFLPKIMPEFIKQHPNIDVIPVEGVSPKLESLVLEDKIDVCVINGPGTNEGLEYQELNSENIILVVPRNSQIAKQDYKFNKEQHTNLVIDMKDLENEKFILLMKNLRLGKISRDIFKYHNINPKEIIEVSNMSTAISMTSVGLGLTFMPESGVDRQKISDECPLYYSIGEPSYNFPLMIAYKKEE